MMTLKAEVASSELGLRKAVFETLRAVTKLGGTVDLLSAGSLANDGKIIADERSYLPTIGEE
jgi:phenylacetate-CoA ligase